MFAYLSAFLVWDISPITIVIGHTYSLHTQLCFEGTRCVIYASVENTTVVARLVHCWAGGRERD